MSLEHEFENSTPEWYSARANRLRVRRIFGILPFLLAGVLLVFLSTPTTAQRNPQDFADVAARAAGAREQNDVPAAIRLYGEAVKLKPKWADGWWFLGSLQYGSGAYSAARDALTHYIELLPDSGPGLAMRGLCEFETGQHSQSLRDIQAALSHGAADQARNESILRFHEALLLTLDGQFEDALRTYTFFAQNHITDPEIFMGIGLAGLRVKLLPRDIDPSQQPLLTATGQATFHFMAGDEGKAQQEFHDLFQTFPTAANTHYLYGYLLFATDPDQALPQFKEELKVAPSNVVAQVMLAWGLLLQEDPSQALPYAKEAEAASPALPSAQLVLGRSLVGTGDLDGGLQHLSTALKLDPDNIEVHLALVHAYSKAGRTEDARRERLQCLNMTKSEAPAVVHP
jgi:tetratricopeptide (TPR) repeat protein